MKPSELLKDEKQLKQYEEILSYGKEVGFQVGYILQDLETDHGRVIVSIYPEGKPSSIWVKYDRAIWYFYIKPDNGLRDFGNISIPESFKNNSVTFKQFKRFMTAVRKRYFERYLKKTIDLTKKIEDKND
jgi:hypothetical protein